MKKLTSTVLLVTGLTAGTITHAQTVPTANKWYTEVGYLSARHTAGGFDFDANGLRVTLGKEVTPGLAVEGFLVPGTSTGTGSITYDGVKANYEGKLKSMYGIYVKPRMKITESAEIFGRLGFAGTSRDVLVVNSTNPADRARVSDSGSDVSYGVGSSIKLTESLSVTLDYMSYYGKSSIKINGYTVGLGYRF